MKRLLRPIATLYNRVPVRLRLAFGLVGLMTGSVLVASAAGFFPNEQREVLRGRARICETLAISSTAMASTGQIESLQITLASVVKRDPAIESIGLVSVNGGLIVSAGPHEEVWSGDMDDHGTHMSVPVFRQAKQWGELQVRFESTGGLLGLNYWAPAWLLIVVIPACFLQFSFFLKKTLQSLDPSGAVPTHVEKALDTFTVGLVLLNSEQRILFANKRLKQLLNKDVSELFGKYVSASDWIVPDTDDDEVSELPWERARRIDDSVHDQILQMDVEGRRLTFTVNCTPITGQGFLTTFDDVTLIEENKVALAEARDAAQSANEAKSEFLANMSHEIRTPLNAVLGFTDVLRRGLVTDSDEAVDHLNMIHRSGAHLLELINDILDLSKIEAGAMEVESIETHVDSVMMDVANTLRVRADENGLDLHVRLQTAIPRVLSSDPTRLRQVITNLVGNAIKFTESGSVSIIAAMRDSEEHTSSSVRVLRIDVVDTGIGMTPEQQSRIFESFAQADTTTTRKFGGTGLGLSISRRLTEALGGTLTVHSKSGMGSTFRIEIGLADVDTSDLMSPGEFNEKQRLRNNQNADSELVRLPGKQVLVVDDGESNRKLIELVLQRAGAAIITAENGLEAIERIAEHSPELVLMDMQMPVLDGYSATERLRESGYTVPIVALTGNAMVGDREKCLSVGCDDFLSKPINLDQLLQLASKYLGPCDNEHADADQPHRESTADSIEFSSFPQNAPKDAANRTPIYPTLPMDDADFRAITVGFLERLPSRLAEIESAIESCQFDALHSDAHWLKGAGGTVGLDVFTSPARDLEAAAKSESVEQAKEILESIRDLQRRVVVSGDTKDQAEATSGLAADPDSNDESIVCSLPIDDPDFRTIVVGFVSKLDERLPLMRNEIDEQQFDELAMNAHWLKGAGGTVGYAALTAPANQLLVAAKRCDSNSCLTFWNELQGIRERMIVPVENLQTS